MTENMTKFARRAWATVRLAGQKFMFIDGGQRAAAFAYSFVLALVPALILFVTAASFFMDHGRAAGAVLSYVGNFVPAAGGPEGRVFEAVSQLIKGRGAAGLFALLMLVWAAAQLFTTLIQASNRAWGTTGGNWWKLPLKSVALLGILTFGVVCGVGIPMLAKLAAGALHSRYILPTAHKLSLLFVPWLAVFFSLTFFYKLAPHRRTKYSEVWLSAFCAAVLLYWAQSLFVFYLRHFSAFNAVYGAFAGVIALLLWVYVSGVIFIFGACLSAAQASTRGQY